MLNPTPRTYAPPAATMADANNTPVDAPPPITEPAASVTDSSVWTWEEVSSPEVSSAGDESDGVESAELAPPAPIPASISTPLSPFDNPIPAGSSPLVPPGFPDSSEGSDDRGGWGGDVGDSSDEMLPLASDHPVDASPYPVLHHSSAVTAFVTSNIHSL